MATYIDRPIIRSSIKAWGQIVLLLSILFAFSAHAASEEISSISAALGVEDAIPDSTATADDDTSETNISTPTPAPPPAINGESTNNGQIETTPTLQKDNDIRQRINGIFSEIEGLQAVTVSVTQGVVTLAGEAANEKKAQQAINLTNRLTDVVTVDDNINRTLDVQENVSTVYQGLKAQLENLVKALPLLLVGIVIFALVTWFGSWLSRRKKMWQRLTPNPFVAELLSQTIKVIFIIFGLILALSLIGAETVLGTLLGGAGVIGIAVGFAVKDTIENYIASLMLSIRQPFRARDQVVINGQEGIVVRLTSRATILMTLDGNQLRIPNAEVFKGTILNYTKNPERRFTFELGVDANDDPLAAIKVGLDAIHTLAFVLNEPKAIAVITNVGDSNIVLEFQVWVDQSETDFAKARSIAIRETKHALEDKGFSLPEPIYRLRFNNKLEKAFEHMQSSVSNTNNVQSDITITPSIPEPIDTNQVSGSHTDDQDKKQAKARAKTILQGRSADEVLDARPDDKLMEKVEQEIAQSSDETDLLNNNSPQE
ncbi:MULTISPECIES: mechanosensitive ion channel domain-containing protein [unclassified Psychrobacter]|uniref:mechanosensitive ion channel domain-containing protein n=1 Tax=unclassified Psychrobacter TaxID=196806 RepID=UPI0008693ADD|nr:MULTISPECIES: mechanosensitive ion channel domain-containing protein [unclassified Psychrobacter]MBA6243467.1 mechanosensitive ion channel [Psychrobacter sp. Urea-trap-18]MBA6286084.1 mechanosensitive ion channel [Psychrobacter sp. Urea-trap-16]MBA6318219.1 mechanosensitive ion channel [Psychrobacter sp. Urea-trap-20]MBA6333737.1 mechanosensitive ion channel [Psychrobacter sp. Urea-trap-19]OEH67704.1 MAG: mechanosensitive ion channel protein MscS [Psychrobacter sp. B29-1]